MSNKTNIFKTGMNDRKAFLLVFLNILKLVKLKNNEKDKDNNAKIPHSLNKLNII